MMIPESTSSRTGSFYQIIYEGEWIKLFITYEPLNYYTFCKKTKKQCLLSALHNDIVLCLKGLKETFYQILREREREREPSYMRTDLHIIRERVCIITSSKPFLPGCNYTSNGRLS